MTHWILIADASGARIVFSQSVRAPLTLVREFNNPRGRQRSQDLDTDIPGRVSKAGAPGTRAAMQPQTTTHEEAAIQFARELAVTLKKELDKGSYNALSVVAPPHFLGILRSELDKNVQQTVRGTVDKDLAHFGLNELKPHLEGLLIPGVAM
jgi:protein required for attachment to host cells